MADIVGPGTVARCKNLYFSISDTERGDTVDVGSLSGNFAIQIDGSIYKISEPPQDSAAITVVGGRDTFVNEKQYRPYSFYITQRQKVTIYKIMKELSQVTNTAQLHSDNELLDQLILNTYANYCG